MAGQTPLEVRLRQKSEDHFVRSLRRNAAVVLELGGGPTFGLVGFLRWLALRDELGLCGDRAEEASELADLEAMAWERHSLESIQARIEAQQKREAKSFRKRSEQRQALLLQQVVRREEARRSSKPSVPPHRQQMQNPNTARPAVSAAPEPTPSPTDFPVPEANRCGQRLGKKIDSLLSSIRFESDELPVLPEDLPEVIEEPSSVIPSPADDEEHLSEEPIPSTAPALQEGPSAWEELVRELPEATARAGLTSRLRKVLKQSPAGGVIQLSASDGQALARLLMEGKL